MREKNERALVLAAAGVLLAAVLTGCSMFNDRDTQTTTASMTASATRRTVVTTKTAVRELTPDTDDEDFNGYTTTTTVTGHLDTDVSFDDGYDMDIRATMTAKAESEPETTTTTKASETKKTTTTTTAFKKDALYQLSDTNSYDGSKTYKVTSDTTYLNLRFGPSRNYDVQLKIPDGETVKGYGQTTDASTGDKWVYIDYNGTNGWVMKKLLKEQ